MNLKYALLNCNWIYFKIEFSYLILYLLFRLNDQFLMIFIDIENHIIYLSGFNSLIGGKSDFSWQLDFHTIIRYLKFDNFCHQTVWPRNLEICKEKQFTNRKLAAFDWTIPPLTSRSFFCFIDKNVWVRFAAHKHIIQASYTSLS